ncbi:hypothetical protein BJ742DRAFT_183716 [Cladochytrium replicatum]|nr:hypothetical protein BJ742DRAFT_183716 [Cladochytrium replicatum]
MEPNSCGCLDLESQATINMAKSDAPLTNIYDSDSHEPPPKYDNSSSEADAVLLVVGDPTPGFSTLLDVDSPGVLLVTVILFIVHSFYSIPRVASLANDAFPSPWQRNVFGSIMLGYYVLLMCAPVMIWRSRTSGEVLRVTLGLLLFALMGMSMLAGAGWWFYVGDGWRHV